MNGSYVIIIFLQWNLFLHRSKHSAILSSPGGFFTLQNISLRAERFSAHRRRILKILNTFLFFNFSIRCWHVWKQGDNMVYQARPSNAFCLCLPHLKASKIREQDVLMPPYQIKPSMKNESVLLVLMRQQ